MEHPFVALMKEKARQVLTLAQGAEVALKADPYTPQDIEMIRGAGNIIAAMVPEFLGASVSFKGRAERATTAFADGLRLIGAALLNMADGIEQQNAALVQMGHSWYVMGSNQVAKAFSIMDAEPPKSEPPAEKPRRNRAAPETAPDTGGDAS